MSVISYNRDDKEAYLSQKVFVFSHPFSHFYAQSTSNKTSNFCSIFNLDTTGSACCVALFTTLVLLVSACLSLWLFIDHLWS